MWHKTWFYHNFFFSFLSRILKIKFLGSNVLEPGSNIFEPQIFLTVRKGARNAPRTISRPKCIGVKTKLSGTVPGKCHKDFPFELFSELKWFFMKGRDTLCWIQVLIFTSEKYFWLSNGTRQRHHTNLISWILSCFQSTLMYCLIFHYPQQWRALLSG